MDRRGFLKALAGALATVAVAPAITPQSNATIGSAIWGDWIPYMFWTGSPSSKIALPSDFMISRISVTLPSEMPYTECALIANEATVSFKMNGKTFYESALPYCYGDLLIQPELMARAGNTLEFESSVPGPMMVVDGRLSIIEPRRTRSSKE